MEREVWGVMQGEYNSSTGIKHGAQENMSACIAIQDGGNSFRISDAEDNNNKTLKGRIVFQDDTPPCVN